MFKKITIKKSSKPLVLLVDKSGALDISTRVLVFRDNDGNGMLGKKELESPVTLHTSSFSTKLELRPADDLVGHFLAITLGVVWAPDAKAPTPSLALELGGVRVKTLDGLDGISPKVQKIGKSWGFTEDLFIHVLELP